MNISGDNQIVSYWAKYPLVPNLSFDDKFCPLQHNLVVPTEFAAIVQQAGLRIRIWSDPVFLPGSGSESVFQISLDQKKLKNYD